MRADDPPSELRLDKVADASSQRVAWIVVGLNGQQLVGQSFFDGRPWRRKLSARSYERGAPGPIRVPGFADTGSHLYEVLGCTDAEAGAQNNTNCRIDEISPPSYSTAPAPIR